MRKQELTAELHLWLLDEARTRLSEATASVAALQGKVLSTGGLAIALVGLIVSLPAIAQAQQVLSQEQLRTPLSVLLSVGALGLFGVIPQKIFRCGLIKDWLARLDTRDPRAVQTEMFEDLVIAHRRSIRRCGKFRWVLGVQILLLIVGVGGILVALGWF